MWRLERRARSDKEAAQAATIGRPQDRTRRLLLLLPPQQALRLLCLRLACASKRYVRNAAGGNDHDTLATTNKQQKTALAGSLSLLSEAPAVSIGYQPRPPPFLTSCLLPALFVQSFEDCPAYVLRGATTVYLVDVVVDRQQRSITMLLFGQRATLIVEGTRSRREGVKVYDQS